jgi:hypothetical protein
MSFEGDDFGFVGPAYEAANINQDAQRLINWYCEFDKSVNAKEVIGLLGTPGLNPFGPQIISPQGGNVRGCWVLPGGLQALIVIGNGVYLYTITVPATQNSIAQISFSQVGLLLTNNGRVVIRDNGALFNGLGGYAVLVDGQYGYFYQLSGGSRTVNFTGNLTSGSSTISFSPGTLVPNTLLVSSGVITDSAAALPANTTITAISFTANTITLSANAASNQTADTFTLTIPAFGQILDPAFLGADRVAFIEGWLIFNQPGTRTFYTNAPVPYTLSFAGAFYALKDATTDNLVSLFEQNREAWLLGETHSEVWFNSGGANFAFSRLPGVGPRVGCAAKHSIAEVGPEYCWLARIGEQGENVIVMTNQYSWVRVSNHAIEHAISQYPLVSDAIGDSYEEEGHIFYQLTFPTADVTWCLDVTTWEDSGGKFGWFQRLSWDPNAGVYHRHRANCMMNFANLRVCGDYQNGQLLQQSRQIYTEVNSLGVPGTAPLRAQRRTPHVWSRRNRKRVFFSSLQIEFKAGVGLQTGQGSNPQCMLRWSDDGAQSWGGEMWAPIGLAGDTQNRAMWFQLGQARDRVWEANYSDPTPRDIIGATLFGEAEEVPQE